MQQLLQQKRRFVFYSFIHICWKLRILLSSKVRHFIITRFKNIAHSQQILTLGLQITLLYLLLIEMYYAHKHIYALKFVTHRMYLLD